MQTRQSDLHDKCETQRSMTLILILCDHPAFICGQSERRNAERAAGCRL